MTPASHSHLRWSYLSTISSTVMQFVAAATITRFLQPSDYGLAAVAMLCYGMTAYFTQLGVGRAIIQKPGLTTGNIRAAFTLAVVTGASGFIVLASASPALARYFKQPRLPLIIIVFGLNLIFQSMGGVAAGLLRRELRMRDLAICDFLAYLLSTFGIGLPMAIHGLGVWAIAGSHVSQPVMAAVAYFIARPHSVLPTFNRIDYARITGFSAKATFTTTVEALAGSMDTVVLGRTVSPLALGLYNRSLTLSTQPGYNLSMGLTRVFFPTLARAAERSREECLRMLISSQRQLMSLIFPVCAGAAVAAPTIIPVVFGRQWGAAVPVFQVLCIVAALDASFHLPAIQLEVFALFRHKLLLQVCFGICFGLGTLLTAPSGGIFAVAIVYAFLQGLRTLGLHHLSARSLGVTAPFLMRSWIPGLVCAGTIAVSLEFVQQGLMTGSLSDFSLARLVILVSLSAIILMFVYRFLYKTTVFDLWKGIFVW